MKIKSWLVSMNKKRVSTLVLMIFLVLSLITTLIVYADVPTIVELEVETRGQDTVLVIRVRHSSPSQTHYVDEIEVEVDGKVEKKERDSQSATTFTVEYTVDSKAADIRIRAHCTNHGWSQWKSLQTGEPTEDGGGIPGFPVESTAIGLAIGAVLLWVAQRQ
jgi:desulfoferrodoxin (superoxide reductase-like protein)